MQHLNTRLSKVEKRFIPMSPHSFWVLADGTELPTTTDPIYAVFCGKYPENTVSIRFDYEPQDLLTAAIHEACAEAIREQALPPGKPIAE